MTDLEIERRLLKNYGVWNGRLHDALRNQARRTGRGVQRSRQRCSLCSKCENGGGLTNQQKDGQELSQVAVVRSI